MRHLNREILDDFLACRLSRADVMFVVRHMLTRCEDCVALQRAVIGKQPSSGFFRTLLDRESGARGLPERLPTAVLSPPERQSHSAPEALFSTLASRWRKSRRRG
jgi:hypothetical protein